MKRLLILFVFIFTMMLTYNVVAQEMGSGDGGTLLTNGVLVTTFQGSGASFPTGVVFNGMYYFVFDANVDASLQVAQYDVNFNYLISYSSNSIACRGAFYNPVDGEVYFKNWGLDLFRLHTNPFDGVYDTVLTNIFQDADSKVCNSLDGTKMYDHLNGIIREYDFATGTILDTIILDLQHDLTWPRGYILAHTGTYFLTFADSVVYAYDINNGSYISSCTLSQHYWNEWSICYTNGMFMVAGPSAPWVVTWYVWTIDQGVPVELTSFTATANSKEVILNWSTATEINNQLFEVQRSFEGSDFATVGFVNGKGTTTERQYYIYRDKILADGKYHYRLKQIDYLGRYEYSDIIEIELRVFNFYLLEQNYPNPFNPVTTIGYGIKEKSNVKITVLNSIGEEVAMLVNEEKESGYHTIEFKASALPSGVYFYQLKAGDFVGTKKMILLK
jgi:hypothetical protein